MRSTTLLTVTIVAALSFPPTLAGARPVEALSGSLGDDAVAFPLQRLGEWQFDPVVQLRLELQPRTLRHGTMGWYIDASLLSHQRIEVGLSGTAGGLYRFQWSQSFYVTACFGVGLGWLFFPGDSYVIQPDGSVDEARDLGRARGLVQTGIRAGFPLPGIEGRPLSLFASYEMIVELPFANGIPLAPHTLLSAGLRWSFADASVRRIAR